MATKKRKIGKKILIGLLAVFIVMQFFRIDKTNPPVVAELDFLEMHAPSNEVKTLMENACYDCHSNKTEYPWYSNVAPVSWFLSHHIEEGREHLNFSEWGNYPEEKRNHKLDECAEEVEEGEMPLASYTWTHGDAKLSAEQKETLETWFKSLMTEGAEGHDEHDEY